MPQTVNTPFKIEADGCAFTECPRWRGGEFYFSDVQGNRVCKLSATGRVATLLELADNPSGLGFLPNGDLLVVSVHDQKLLRVLQDGSVREHAAEQIATSHPRIEGFVIGGADLVESMRARNTPERLPLLGPLTHTILVARAYGLTAIDAIHPNFENDDGFAESCRQAAELGFDGKSVAFARQLPVAHAAFLPSPDAIAQARRAVAAASQSEANSRYESSHLAHARRVLAIIDMSEAHAAALR
jgi:hypothetical protein